MWRCSGQDHDTSVYNQLLEGKRVEINTVGHLGLMSEVCVCALWSTLCPCDCFIMLTSFTLIWFLYIFKLSVFQEFWECIYWVINLDFPNLIILGRQRAEITLSLFHSPSTVCVSLRVCVIVRSTCVCEEAILSCTRKEASSVSLVFNDKIASTEIREHKCLSAFIHSVISFFPSLYLFF